MNSDTKQLHYSNRTFDIIPNVVTPRNFNLERGVFNQASELEFKNPDKSKYIKDAMNNPKINQYKNPYLISQTDFSDNSMSRKIDKRNRTNIFNQRLDDKSAYINQFQNNNSYADRFYQLDQKNENAHKLKNIKTSDNLTFQEYLEFKHKMSQHDGMPKY